MKSDEVIKFVNGRWTLFQCGVARSSSLNRVVMTRRYPDVLIEEPPVEYPGQARALKPADNAW